MTTKPEVSNQSRQGGQTGSEDALVEMLFRNGTLTVVGIVLSFSLGFLTQWAHNPIPWAPIDAPGLIALTLGVVGQARALAILLRHDSLQRPVYDRSVRWFKGGASLTIAGVLFAIAADAYELVY